LPIIGVEPAIKPAIKKSKTGNIGVIGTRNTLTSNRFQALKQSLLSEKYVQFIIQSCDGLALAVEDSYSKADFSKSPLFDTTNNVFKLCDLYLNSMGVFGSAPNMIDTLVLGCTHYIFALPSIREIVGNDVSIIENGIPVAEQVERVLADTRNDGNSMSNDLKLLIYTTGKLSYIEVIMNNMSINAKRNFRHAVI
jgi:glutamate racemase